MKKKVLLLGLAAVAAAGIFGYRHWQQQRSVNGGDTLTLYGNVDIRKVTDQWCTHEGGNFPVAGFVHRCIGFTGYR